MRRPVIGISGNLIPIENDGVFTGNLRQYIHTDYTSSVERAGVPRCFCRSAMTRK